MATITATYNTETKELSVTKDGEEVCDVVSLEFSSRNYSENEDDKFFCRLECACDNEDGSQERTLLLASEAERLLSEITTYMGIK